MENEINNETSNPSLIASTKLYFQDLFVGAKKMSRADFWWGYLGITILTIAIMAIFAGIIVILPISDYYWSAIAGVGFAITLGYYLIALFNAAIRRLHDTGKKAWWMLFLLLNVIGYIVLVVLLCQKSSPNGWTANE